MTRARGAGVDVGPKAGTASPPFVHTPYDGSARPFTVGLMPLDLADWIEPDALLAAHLAEKDRLLSGAAQAPVLLAEENTRQAQQEVLGLLAGHLPARFPDLYARNGQRIEIIGTGRSVDLCENSEMPLALAARLVQEDLVIMRKGETGYRLAAAALFFPSSWSLADKFGKSMEAIHETVPGFNDGRMGPMVARIFDNLAVGRPSWRLNWSLYSDPGLHHPSPKRISAGGNDTSRVDGAREALHVRVERQTLRRLPDSGDILFTIKVHHDPVAAFARHPQGAMLAAGLRRQLLELAADQLAYKGLAAERDAIAEALGRLAANIQNDKNR
ncbi:heme-dependent oxidative N-demethylase family protein [Stappia sp.]|uniref:heme-dependent oxidative N-demethylase family protein n=1 Tax=Stappia sp. TaxID=1870903 RepID=UPI003A99269A